MILGIGAFRLSSSGYVGYTIAFDDVAGLSRKAEVKIAGVKVGWVEELELIHPHHKARATIMINEKYRLYDNASAIVRQEGLIGTKYLEVIPGDPLLSHLSPGSELAKAGRDSVSIDELLHKFNNIASHVEQITESMKEVFAGAERNDQLKATMENISLAAEKFNNLATSLHSVTSNNEENMHSLISDFQEFARTLKEDMPSYKENLDRFSTSIESDFSKISHDLSSSANSIELAAQEATEGFQSISSIIEKIDDGRGLIGKMVNEDELYHDIKSTVSGIKNYLAKFETLGVVFDLHSENMHRPTDHFTYADSKGYLNIRIHTSDSFFYIAQIVASEKGFLNRHYIFESYFDKAGVELDYSTFDDAGTDIAKQNQFQFAPEKLVRERSPLAYGFQFGKIYKDLAFRLGIFEGTFGVGADYYIPFSNDKIAWTTTLEAFDFHGTQRFDMTDRRPHLKWMNRIFFMNNLYFVFGADDFISQTNANAFWGIGIRFGDDDMKYILSKFGLYVTV
jgi:phospholipid/cholesterol/gamma-HCH transport system substrate-binding protein